MKLFKRNIYVAMVLGVFFLSNSYGQIFTKTKQHKFTVKNGVAIELNSKYTNIELEVTDTNVVEIDAVMDIEGLSKTQAEAYFKKWTLKADKQDNKLVINTSLFNKNKSINKKGYYEGFFIDSSQFEEITKKIKNYARNSQKKEDGNLTKLSKERKGYFDYDAYVKEGNTYLLKWQKTNNEPIGKRWFNKTKKERIQLQKVKKAKQSNKKTVRIEQKLGTKLKKNVQPKKNVRSLPKRAIINKTLKIRIPRNALLHLKVRHGKIVISDSITNLKADLSYVLLQANKIRGVNTLIRGKYSNFEIGYWKAGNLETIFSDFTLIKKAESLNIISNTSTVSIDTITKNINAQGSFKMLSVDASPEIKQMNINVEDSKKVWIKLPKIAYNLFYEGINSKLIHPQKFSLKTIKSNPRKQLINHTSIKKSERQIRIKAVSSAMQVYDIPWKDLKIKNL